MEVFGGNSSITTQNITVEAEGVSTSINGSDSVRLNIVDRLNATSGQLNGSASEVPGLGMIQLVLIMLLAYTAYYRRL